MFIFQFVTKIPYAFSQHETKIAEEKERFLVRDAAILPVIISRVKEATYYKDTNTQEYKEPV